MTTEEDKQRLLSIWGRLIWSLYNRERTPHNLKYIRENDVVSQSSFHSQGKLGCTQNKRAVIYSWDKSPNLTIVLVNTSYKVSLAIRPICDLVHYTKEDIRAIRETSPLALWTGRATSTQSFLLSTNMGKLILETQTKPLTNARLMQSLVNSSSTKSPLLDELLNPPLFFSRIWRYQIYHIMIPLKGKHTITWTILRTSSTIRICTNLL